MKTLTAKGRGLAAIAFASIAIAGVGCGSSGSTGGTATGAESPTNPIAIKAQKKLAELYKGNYQNPPAQAPKPTPGENVWAVSIGNSAETAAAAIGAFEEASKALGWKETSFDGKFEPNLMLTGVRNAVNANADGIWLDAIDCATVKSGLIEAKRAGIPVVITAAEDCEPSLATFVTGYVPGDRQAYFKALGEAQGWATVAKTNGEAKVLSFVETDATSLTTMAAGFESVIDQCPSCEILDTVDFVGTEMGAPLQQKAEQALLRNPSTNVVYGNYDEPVATAIAPAVRARKSEALVVGCEGNKPNIQLAREGLEDIGVGYPGAWEGFAGADALVRIFAGQKPIEDSGMGIQVWDPEHNMPPEGESYQPPIDLKADYFKAWGVE